MPYSENKWWASILLLAGFSALLSCQKSTEIPEPLIPVRLAVPEQSASVLMMVAVDRKLFRDFGLDVTILRVPSGKRAMDVFLNGDADAAGAASPPLAAAALANRKFRLLTGYAVASALPALVARKDRGIESISDLRGKRVGTQEKSTVHFYLHLLCLSHGIDETRDVDLVFMNAEELAPALARGDLDAFCMREPFVTQAEVLTEGDVSIFRDRHLITQIDALVVRSDWTATDPACIGLVRALLEAERQVAEDSRLAVDSLVSWLGVSEEQARRELDLLSLVVELDSGLESSLQHQMHWLMRLAGGDDSRARRNIRDWIDLSCMREAAPERMLILE